MTRPPANPRPKSRKAEVFNERVERLADELKLAVQWNRPSILFAIYQSHIVMQNAQAALSQQLSQLGQRVEVYRVDDKKNVDIPLRLSEHPARAETVFFVLGLRAGRAAALRALNIRREYFVEYRIRAVFWLIEQEAIALAHEAPDFWAFRHRVIDFAETADG